MPELPSLAGVRCRTLGHSWDPIPVTEPPAYGVAIDLRCEFCYTIRRDIVSRYSGQVMSRRYIYEEEYRTHDEGLTRSDWRVMWVDTLSDALRVIGPIGDEELDDAEDDEPAIRILAAAPTKGRKAS
jgi:hypothetical protein